MSITSVSKLQWKEPEKGTVECAGEAFVDYHLRAVGERGFRYGSAHNENDATLSAAGAPDASEATATTSTTKKKLNLLELSSEELEDLTYYEVLGDLPLHATSEQVKKAFHRASLKYHPDKTGRGKEDEVFLKVKAAFDTLGDREQRKAYDSTHLEFDDSIPPADSVSTKDFYSVYAPVFERNLRFDQRLLDPNDGGGATTKNSNNNNSNSNNKRNGKKNRNKQQQRRQSSSSSGPPSLGDDTTPMSEVHAFYEYWTRFESWRDFTLVAAKEQNEHYDPDQYDSRYEKRFFEKEIAKRAAKLKREEMSRLTMLVERAMAADPRLIRERQQQKEEKLQKQREREEQQRLAEEAKRKEEERIAKEKAKQAEEERAMRLSEKADREKQKKQLRKTKQLFRKLVLAAYNKDSSLWNGNMEAMNDHVEFLCEHLEIEKLAELNSKLGGTEESVDASQLNVVIGTVQIVRKDRDRDLAAAEKQRQANREADAAKRQQQKLASAAAPWTKEELSALAKGVKKYPPGGANRWDTIALFVNNLCKQDKPRTKEECIEKYNQVGQKKPTLDTKQSSSMDSESTATSSAWTDEQNKALQAALKQFPASMDKNERWSSIAKAVPGKTKKECVARFKAIRLALKNKQ